MQNSKLNELLAEIRKSQQQQKENRLHLQAALYTFKARLNQVKQNIENSEARFNELTGKSVRDTQVTLMTVHRRAS